MLTRRLTPCQYAEGGDRLTPMQSLGARIRCARLALDLTQEAFAEALHVSPSTSSRWERGVQTPDLEDLKDIAALCNRRMAWFLEGELLRPSSRRVRRRPPEGAPGQLEEHHTRHSVRIPVYPRVPGGSQQEPLPPAEAFIDAPALWVDEHHTTYGLVVEGSSMEPDLREGDIVVVRRRADAGSGDVVVAAVAPGKPDSGGWVCSQLQQVGGRLQLHSINPAVADPPPDEPFEIDGRVIGLFRAL